MINITLNGKPHSVINPKLSDLIRDQGLVGRRIAVEHNGSIIKRGNHESVSLVEGDVIEILQFVGGG